MWHGYINNLKKILQTKFCTMVNLNILVKTADYVFMVLSLLKGVMISWSDFIWATWCFLDNFGLFMGLV